jgi:hypothetical protein
MLFAEYYHLSTGWNGTDYTGPKVPIRKCGTDGILYLDGRYGLTRAINEAAKFGRRLPDVTGFVIRRGPRLDNARDLTTYVTLVRPHRPIPADFSVQPLAPGQSCPGKMTCGHCGLSWDDSQSTTWTPVPAGRCPFEHFHVYVGDIKAPLPWTT